MSKVQPTPPPGVDLPVGGSLGGANPYPGGDIEVDDVTPLGDQSDRTFEAASAPPAPIAQ